MSAATMLRSFVLRFLGAASKPAPPADNDSADGAGAGGGEQGGTKQKKASDDADTSAAESRWVTATVQVRETAKWTVATAGAAGAVVFGGGPLLTRGDPPEDAGSVLLILASAMIGVLGIAYLIARASQVLLPYEVTINDLPADLKASLDADPDRLLPSGSRNVEHFATLVRTWPRALHNVRSRIAAIDRQFAELREHEPKPAALVAERRALTDRLPDIERNAQIYLGFRDELLERSAYSRTRAVFTEHRGRLVAAVMAMTLGATSYLLLLGAEDTEDDAASPSPRVARLVPGDDDAAAMLWSAASLDRCDEQPGNAEVDAATVLVLSGSGTPDSPYVVQTLAVDSGADSCPEVQFNTVDDVARVVFDEPAKIVVEYSAAD